MKKYLVMALAAMLPLAFVSCGSDSDDTPSKKPTTLTKLSTDEARLFEKIIAASGTDSEMTKKTPGSIEFTPEKMVLIHYDLPDGASGKGKTKDLSDFKAKLRTGVAGAEPSDPWDFEWVIGEYTVSGSNYSIPGYGSIDISGGATNLNFQFFDGTQCYASSTPVDYNQYNASQVGAWTCRLWRPTATRIVVMEGANEKFSGQWNEQNRRNGCNLATIATNIKNTIGDFDDAELQELGELRRIYFSPAGRVTFYFQRAAYRIYNGAWSLDANQSFSWVLDGNVGNSLINAVGSGSIEFDGNEAAVTLKFTANKGKYSGYVMFRLAPINS